MLFDFVTRNLLALVGLLLLLAVLLTGAASKFYTN